ncbi:MAG: YbhN family protein [Acidimicrobiia bacterium]
MRSFARQQPIAGVVPDAVADLPLHRTRLVRRLVLLVLASAAVVMFAGRADGSRSALRVAATASPPWLALAVLTTAGTYASAALITLGATPTPLPVRSTVLAQVAAAFANRLAPAGLGGAALTVRYLQRVGATRPQAIASVAVGATTVSVVHVVAFVVLVPLVGVPAGIAAPDGTGVLVASSVALVVAGAVLGVARADRHLPRSVAESASGFVAVLRHRRRRNLVLAGAALLTALHCITLWSVAHSVGASATLGECTLVYLAAAAIGAISPTPGGLGAIEAALIAGLSASVGVTDAAAAVVVYHLLSFWLPVVPGAVGFARLHRRRLV